MVGRPREHHKQVSQSQVAEWPRFGRGLLIRFSVCSLCILTFVILVIPHFGFDGASLVLIAAVPGHCLSFNF